MTNDLNNILQECSQWAIKQNFHKYPVKGQIKKVAEELTEGFVHLHCGDLVDDDVGDILIATNTWLTINFFNDDLVTKVDNYASLIKSIDEQDTKFYYNEWVDEYTECMKSLYNKELNIGKIITLASGLRKLRSKVDITTIVGDCFNTISGRHYTDLFTRD